MSPTPGFPAPSTPSTSTPSTSSPSGPNGVPARWPLRPEFLTDTTLCPACFGTIAIAPLPTVLDGSTGPVCTVCRLDLSVPEAHLLLEAGSAVALAESSRQVLLTRMRGAQMEREQVVTRARAAAAAVPVYAPQAYPVPQPFPTAQPAATLASNTQGQSNPFATGNRVPQPQHPSSTEHPMAAKPRRSGVQILMLTVGVILVSVMALFFVLVAYLVASLEVRSLLTGVASVAVFGVAVLLLRRRLQGTAEGIASLAVVLFLLDLWIIRANGVFGSANIDGWLYAGLSAGLLTALLAVGARAIPLRTLSLSAVLIGPFASFALVQGLLVDVDGWTRAWTALTSVGVASLIWTRLERPLERTILLAGGMIATAVAALCAFGAFPELPAARSMAFAVVAGVWLVMLAAAPARRVPDGADAARPIGLNAWDVIAAVGLGLAASGAGLSLFLGGRVVDAILWLPASVTALAALLVAALTHVAPLARLVPALRLAAVIPLGVAGLAAAPAFGFTVATSAWGATTTPFSVPAFGVPANPLVQMGIESPLALILVAAIGIATLATLGRAQGSSWIPAGIGGLGLIGASASIGQPVASALCLGFLAAALLAAVVVVEQAALRLALGIVFAAAVVVFGTIGLTSTATFPVTAIASVVLLASARQTLVRLAAAPVTAALAVIATGSAAIALVLSARMVPAWFESVTGTTAGVAMPALWMTVVALLVGAAIPFAVDLLSRADAAVLSAVAAVAAVIGISELYAQGSPVPLFATVVAAAAASLAWQVPGRAAAWPERFVTAAVAPAAIVGAVDIAWPEFAPALLFGAQRDQATGVVLAGAIVVLAAVGAVLFPRRDGLPGTSPARVGWDGALAVAAVAVVVSATVEPELGWLTLVLLAVAAVLVASGDGDIVAGTSPRRHVAWLGLPLAVAGLWLGLLRADVTVVEFYTLPVSALLFAILGVLLIRRPVADGRVQPGRSALLAAALAVSVGPSAIASAGAEPLRTGVVLGMCAILIAAGAFLPPVFRGLRCSVVVWLAGVSGATLTSVGSAAINRDGSSIPFEVWSAGGAFLLLAAGLLWHRQRQTPAALATAAVVASVLVLTLPTLTALLTGNLDAWRGLLVLVVLCGYLITASVHDEFSPAFRWASAGCAVVLACALLVTGTVDPFELATVPLAVALIVGGVRLSRHQKRGSWAELGPGLGVLLVPSLVANLGLSNELWRVVTLGVVALLVFGAGLALKLQAPTLIGAVVVVAHGLAQLWPWISDLYGSVPWWLWAGVGGVTLIVLAATYESRIRDLKAAARGITSLR
ncbi:SCO7613 C-terminal domain-containing membrane protein [Mycetocola miduiensis]|uniref:SCO7613 C-terminal domain-containing membrane protein n=1 Tax=Mycetocola miduiensis TaxID=995034 RepID=UPI00116034E3|nr:hypothetical protein [Mycetocola miduiensis]